MSERDVPLAEDEAPLPEPPPGAILTYDDNGTWIKSTLARKTGSGLLYFIQGRTGDPVKIGFTSHDDVTSRIRTLQTSYPYMLGVLATIPGTMRDERAIHKALAPERLMGEWFEWSRRTVHLVQMLAVQKHPLTDALAAINGMDVPDCPNSWDDYFVAESNTSALFHLSRSNVIAEARKAGRGPHFKLASAVARRGRYYRLSDLKRWLVEQQTPHALATNLWNSLVFDGEFLEDTPQ